MKKSNLKTKCDALFSKRVREKESCQLRGLDLIGCGGNLQCMHIITRANMRLRYDLMNVLSGCQGHHVYYTNHPYDFYKLLEKEFPEKMEYIEKHRNEMAKIDYEDLYMRLKNNDIIKIEAYVI